MMSDDPPQPKLDSDEEFLRRGKDEVQATSSDQAGRGDETETADPMAARLPRHVTIKGYDIIRELHRGGQGIVYEAIQKSTKRKVAIKILLEGGFASPAARRRFQREITLAAGLKHPNIIAIFDSGETPDGHQFCVMDYVRGRSIRDYVRENKLPLEDTLKLFSSVCEAAHFANQKGVVHRDLKPSNILVDTDGVPRVLDFGLAKQLAGGEASLVSMTGQVVGTLQYMSPEQTRGNPDEIDARSDVYSLGVILYELLTGTHPYPVRGEMYEVVKHITETEPTPPSKVWSPESGVSERKSRRFRVGQCPIDNEIQTIVFKALAKNRDRRYQSADALRQDISSYLRGEPIEAKRDSSLYILKKSLRRHRVRIAVTIGFVAVAAAALYVGSRTGVRREPALAPTGPITSLAVLPLENLSGDPEQEYFADGMTGELVTALGKIGALKVISRMSVMGYKDTSKSLPEIARELNVDALVEGTVTRFGNRVRIAANLIRAATSEQLWGDSYECDMRDVLALQGEIARAIAEQIKVNLTSSERKLLAAAPQQVDPAAYDAYIRGMELVRRGTRESLQTALVFFDQALAIDPGFALGYAGRANAWSSLGSTHMHPAETLPAVKRAADAALALNENLAEAHISIGNYRIEFDWDWDGAEQAYKRALELNPNLSKARLAYALYLAAMKRPDEATTQLNMVRELDPAARYTNGSFGAVSFMARRFDQTIRDAREALRVDSEFWPAHSWQGLAQAQLGQFAEGISHLRKALEICKSPQAAARLGGVLASAGNHKEARSIRKELKEFPDAKYVCPYAVATISIGLGEFDEAFEEMHQACEDRGACIPWLQVDPRLDPIRDDPRFDELLERVGFEPQRRLLFVAQPGAERIMLAVLPFEDMSPDPQEWFSDGMTEEMIAQLGRMNPKKLGVIARTSAMRYKNTTKSIDRIGRELSVEYILEGSVLRVGERVRITAQLIQVSDQTHLWADTYDRTTQDVFAIQSDVARRVAGALAVTLLPEDQSTLDREPTTSSVAHDAYLKGLYYWNKRTESSLQRAIQFFESAVETDPDFALAHVGLALAHVVLAGHGYLAPTVAFVRIKEEAEKAIALDETLGEAHLARALYRSYEWNHRGAEDEFREAIRLNPAHPTTHQWYAEFLVGQGHFEEALAHIKQAQHLDPASRIINTVVGLIYYRAHRFDEAVEQMLKALDFAPSFPYAHFVLGRCYAEMGLFEEAVAEVNQAITLGERSIEYVAALGYAYARGGRVDEARRIVDELHQRSRTQYVSEYELTKVYVGLGEMDEAFRRLDRAFDQRALLLGWTLRVDPSFKSLHDDPRFDDLLLRAGFELQPKPQSTEPLGAKPPDHPPASGG